MSEKDVKKDGPSFKGKKLGVPDVDGWWVTAPGEFVEGRAVGRFQIEQDDGKVRDIVLVELTKPAKCVMNEKPVVLQPGQVAGVGIGAKNAELLNYVTKRGLVYCKALTKKDIGSGRKMWTYDVVGEEGKEAPPPPIASRAHSESDQPF